jgi:2,4-dienoyl-CoA reductase (NADPH2)
MCSASAEPAAAAAGGAGRTAFPRLLSPIAIGPLRLSNRVVMGSMHTGLEEAGDWGRVADFYAARATAGLIVTGGVAPTPEGAVFPGAAGLWDRAELARHRRVTAAVHAAGGRIALQILHAGRYAYGRDCVAPSALRSPISPHAPAALDAAGIARTLAAYGRTAALAAEAGYDGVEVMASEGYLLNQFLAPRTNRRDDAWGGSPAARMRLPLEALARVREALGPGRALLLRLSLIDLVPEGQDWAETLAFARAAAAAGADAVTAGIGWHESRVPTIAAPVPRGAWTWLAARLRAALPGLPVAAANRIPSPEAAEAILAAGAADLVSLARPFLADEGFVAKAQAGRPQEIAPCIACNQACLDHAFAGKPATCLVNPRAGREAEFAPRPAVRARAIAVVGAGPAGLACALAAAGRGHRVTLWEREARIGGQLRLAAAVPGKEEFAALLAWWETMLAARGVETRLGAAPDPGELAGYEAVVVATGLRPRRPAIPGHDLPHVATYADLLAGRVAAGRRVAVVGAGGIGFDVAAFLVAGPAGAPDLDAWLAEWGVADPALARGGLAPEGPRPAPARREVTMLQRSEGRLGRRLGRTTGWIHRAHLAAKGVRLVAGAAYDRIAPEGLWIAVAGEPRLVEADTVVLCAGQESVRGLADRLPGAAVIGGAARAAGIDAQAAIEEGTRLGLAL